MVLDDGSTRMWIDDADDRCWTTYESGLCWIPLDIAAISLDTTRIWPNIS